VLDRLDRATDLAEALCQVAEARSAAPAVLSDPGHWSYGCLAAAADALATALKTRPSFQRGGRVALIAGQSAAYIGGLFGILRAGGIVVPLSAELEADRLASILRQCEVSLVLTAGRLPPRLAALLPTPAERLDLNRPCGETTAPTVSDRNAPAAIMATGGSYGAPKLVTLSHGNLLANARAIIARLGITPADRALAALPFPHAFGNSVLLTHLLAGASLAIAGSMLFPNSILEAIRTHGATSFSGVPEMYRILLSRSDLGRAPLPSLRTMTVAGGALGDEAAADLSLRIRPARLFLMYGQTEATARIAILDPAERDNRPGSSGTALPETEIRIADEEGRALPAGSKGEICVRGPGVMLGYWGCPEETARTLREGWLRTGDTGSLDADGFLYVRGRANGVLKIAGHCVHPHEIESFVTARFQVYHAAAVACPTPLGARLALFVEAAPHGEPVTPAEIVRRCRAELPRHQVPVVVEVLPSIPLTAARKIDRILLARRAAEHLTQREEAAPREPD
jgi:acyl-CoA synthetase (AMP-forming)/AMP-acid ligase II